MDNVRWVKMKSWHISAGFRVTGDGGWKLVCGRVAVGEEVDKRGDGKTCESCLRIAGPH